MKTNDGNQPEFGVVFQRCSGKIRWSIRFHYDVSLLFFFLKTFRLKNSSLFLPKNRMVVKIKKMPFTF